MKIPARLRHKRLQLAFLIPLLLLALVVPSFISLTNAVHAAPRCECNTDYHCGSGETCNTGAGCREYQGFTGLCKSGSAPGCVDTPIGCIPTAPGAFAQWILGVGIELGIIVATLLIIIGGFQVVSSTGDPERLADAKSRITAAIAGLLFILFSVIILRIIGVEIIGISF